MKIDVAELSQPNCQFKEDKCVKNKKCRWKRTSVPHKSMCTNWQAPFLWPSIDTAAQKSFPAYSPTEIIRLLHHENHKVYMHLHPCTVQWWIQKDRLPRQPIWKDSILKHVEAGNKPLTTIKGCWPLFPQNGPLAIPKGGHRPSGVEPFFRQFRSQNVL